MLYSGVGPLPKQAIELGFQRNPIPYETFGQYSAKSGAKLEGPEMTELEALQTLLPKRLIKVFRARAKAYLTGKDRSQEYSKGGFWKYLDCSACSWHCAVFR